MFELKRYPLGKCSSWLGVMKNLGYGAISQWETWQKCPTADGKIVAISILCLWSAAFCLHLIQVEGALENLKKSLIIQRPWNILNKSLIIQRPWNILNKSLIIQRPWNILNKSLITQRPWNILNKSLIIQRPWNILNKSLIIQRLFWFDCVITVFAWLMRKASRVGVIRVPAYFCHLNYIPAGGV
jgi:hypothetical protein